MKTRKLLLTAFVVVTFECWQNVSGHQYFPRVIQNIEQAEAISENLINDLEKEVRYEPTWESLDSRPLPAWFDQAKVGIFIHWGVFSVPGFGNEWFWYNWKGRNASDHIEFMKKNYPPDFTYQDFGPQFTAEFYNPGDWAELFNKSGAKYVVLTSKHHEGYTLWPSKYSFSWNAEEVGAHRDLLGELADAIRSKTSLHFGLYHSMYEWFNPLWVTDKAGGFKTDEFVRFKTMPELYELAEKYRPEVIWSDGEWEAPSDYWQSTKFLAWLYNESPVKDTVVVNDRWGSETRCKNGGFYNCDDSFNPGVLQPHKWENCYTLDKSSWGHRRNAQIQDYRTPEEVIRVLVETVSCGGNLLLNVGPTKEGMIVPIQEERLLQLGQWLSINGDAIYESTPWTAQKDSEEAGVWYTANPSRKQVYAIVLNWPGSQLHLGSVNASNVNAISILGSSASVWWTTGGSEGITVYFPHRDLVASQWAWTVVIHEK